MHGADLSDLLIVFIKWLAVFPVEESGDADNFFLLVDNGQRQNVLDDKTCVVHSLFLKEKPFNQFPFFLKRGIATG